MNKSDIKRPSVCGENYGIDQAVRDIIRVGVCPAPKGAVRKILERLLSAQTKAPMGVSQWLEHGKKYGYDIYFTRGTRSNPQLPIP